MNFNWNTDENKHPQEVDMKSFYKKLKKKLSEETDEKPEERPEEIPKERPWKIPEERVDNVEPWLGNCLLDLEAFKQYKKSKDLENGEEYYSEIKKQYEKIDEIIFDGWTNALLLQDLRESEPYIKPFEREMANFIKELSGYLHSPHAISKEGIRVPKNENKDLEDQFNDIRNVLAIPYEDEENDSELRRTNKAIVRNSLIRIAEKYSIQSKQRYYKLRMICKMNKIHTIYSYDYVRVALCPEVMNDYEGIIESKIEDTVFFAFENRLKVDHFNTGESTNKINDIKNYFDNRDNITPQSEYYDDMNDRLRGYFQRRRCVAIMEFPQKDSNDMFSLSGNELLNDKTYDNSFETDIADIIKQELNMRYLFCKQRVTVKRYCHRDDKGFHVLPQSEMLKFDKDWPKTKIDYSCCERKFLAKIEEDVYSGQPYPKEIELWTRFKICDNCELAIKEYEKTHPQIHRC